MKRIKLTVAASAPLSEAHCLEIDWSKCCLCQKITSEPLTCPGNNPIVKNKNLGYVTLGANLEKLEPYNYILESGFKVNDLDEGNGIQDTLKERIAKYHKNSCARKFLPVDNILKELSLKIKEDEKTSGDVADSNNNRGTRS